MGRATHLLPPYTFLSCPGDIFAVIYLGTRNVRMQVSPVETASILVRNLHFHNFHAHTYVLCILILPKFYSPTDAKLNCLKNNFKIYIKIDTKTAATCFGAITPSSSGSAPFDLAKVTFVEIIN